MNTVKAYEGREGIKNAYQEVLGYDRVDIICLSSAYENVIGNYFDTVVSPKLYGGMIATREILPDTSENRAYASKKDVKNQVRFFKALPAESDMMVVEDKVVLVSYNTSSPHAIVLSDPETVKSFRVQFEVLWGKIA